MDEIVNSEIQSGEVAKILKMGRTAVWKWTIKGKIPYKRKTFGDIHIYDRAVIEALGEKLGIWRIL